ncbi:LuxR C-terminal-related transcriptional regulator [Desulfoluna spongiiphila]|nr:LuxR C-terminal-related transcriptional regulator [Desulfoluna spongiiphila]
MTKQRIRYHTFFTCLEGPMAKPGSIKRASVMAGFFFDIDLAFLFPYINAVIPGAELHEAPSLIRFEMDGVFCVLYPSRCFATPFADREEAGAFRDKMMSRLNEIQATRDSIVPKHKVFKHIAVPDILKLLPLTNCKACGFPTCLAFASMVSRQKALPSRCPHIGPPVSEQVTYPVLDAAGRPVDAITFDVDTAHDPQKTVPPPKAPPQFPRAMDEANATLMAALTPREVEVLALLGKGFTNPEISAELGISPHTVKSHVTHLFNKLNVSDRTQAAVWAAHRKII